MNPDEYVEQAMRTLRSDPDHHFQLNHALHGLASEVGEIADAIKKHIVYGQPLDVDNLEEEVGDLLWYIALLCYSNAFSLETVMIRNIVKLAKRYPDKFTPEAAVARADKS